MKSTTASSPSGRRLLTVVKQPIHTIAFTNINLIAPPAVIGGRTLLPEDRVLLTAQTENEEDGIYGFDGDELKPSIDWLNEEGQHVTVLGGTYAGNDYKFNNGVWSKVNGSVDVLLSSGIIPASSITAGRSVRTIVSNGVATVHADDVMTEMQFDTTGASSSIAAVTGEILTFSRASDARFCANGALVVAPSGQARVCDDGLIIEPECTNISPNFSETWGSGFDGWAKLDTDGTMTAGAADPFGGTTAFTYSCDTGNTGHGALFYFGNQSGYTFSLWIKQRGTERYLSMGRMPDGAYGAVYDLQKAQVVSTTGSGTRAAIEVGANGWLRCEITITASIAQGIYWQLSIDGINWTHTTTSANGAYVYWPQFENNPYATSLVTYNTTRAADAPMLIIPYLGADWSIEVKTRPIGPGSWKRSTGTNADGNGDVIFSLGEKNAGNTALVRMCHSGSDGALYLDTYDGATAFKSTWGTGFVSASARHGWHDIVVTSDSEDGAHPCFLTDNARSSVANGSGAGSGAISPSTVAGLRLYLGCTSVGNQGGVIIRSVIVRRRGRGNYRPVGAALSQHAGFARGGFTRAQCVACLGDSNMVPSTTVATDESFVRTACKALGLADHNWAVGGVGANMALARLQDDISLGHHTRCVVMIGTNDLNGGASASHVEERLTRIIEEASHQGIALVLCTLPPLPGFAANCLAVNTWIRALTTVTVCDINAVLRSGGAGTDGTWNAALTTGDGLHANTDGQAAMAIALIASLST